jgi:hypothetical protein
MNTPEIKRLRIIMMLGISDGGTNKYTCKTEIKEKAMYT